MCFLQGKLTLFSLGGVFLHSSKRDDLRKAKCDKSWAWLIILLPSYHSSENINVKSLYTRGGSWLLVSMLRNCKTRSHVACLTRPHTFTFLRSKHEPHQYYPLRPCRENITKHNTKSVKTQTKTYFNLMLFWDAEQTQLRLDKYFLIIFICEWQPIGREVGG